jgi:hypothetical protein
MREIRIFYQKCAFWGTDSGVRLPRASANRWARLDKAGGVRALTRGPISRRLRNCEGCGSGCVLCRIILPENRAKIKENEWQTMYRR